ncbi:MAG: alginate O-acetyltransferase complex protein AlgI [Verrucomicrobiota bacterium]|jgi:D-alanyl-lipoteichoic acid acyltransferase DltB (MBOAT superfamily)
MLFNSLEFAIFFPVVTFLYFILGGWSRLWLLLVASCVFYMAWKPVYIVFLFALIGIDYVAAFFIESAKGHSRKLYLGLSLAANLSLLGYFKYFNFFNDNVGAVAHSLGWNYRVEPLHLLLPIGLSFHTFQAMSYTMEVYYGRRKAERNLLIYALYVLFYPQLVAGPIERPQNLIHQFRERHTFSYDRFVRGFQLMLTGFFKKMAIADRLSPWVDMTYKSPASFSGGELLVATYFFGVQIYCDFSGYTDIARGAATIMGFQIMENFERPYLATSIAEFWRRWHISLSTWFRDYLYRPLGGNRGTLLRTCFNLTIVFLLSGLWHGANWTYVIWGALNGAMLIIFVTTNPTRAWISKTLRLDRHTRLHNVIAVLITSNLVVFTWIFFRAKNFGDALIVIRRIFSTENFAGFEHLHASIDGLQFVVSLLLIVGLFAVEGFGGKKVLWSSIDNMPTWLRWSAYYSFVILLIVLVLTNPAQKAQQFIYFQF